MFGTESLALAGRRGRMRGDVLHVPASFFFILAGGPLVETTHGQLALHGAADGHHGGGRRRHRQSRGVLRLARVLATGRYGRRSTGGLDSVALAFGIAAAIALFRFKANVIAVIVACGAAGYVAQMLLPA